MKRVYFLGGLLLALEIWAFSLIRSHPLVRPEWFTTLLLAIELTMVVGGLYGARWLVHQSPLVHLESPRQDWTKLWLWCGPMGGVLLALACVLGKLITDYTGTLILGVAVAAHLAAGAVLWVLTLPWAASDLFNDPNSGIRERWLMQLGVASHVLGIAVYVGFFPGHEISPLSLLGAAMAFAFNAYYLMAISIAWSIVFRYWYPQPTSKDNPSPLVQAHQNGDILTESDADSPLLHPSN